MLRKQKKKTLIVWSSYSRGGKTFEICRLNKCIEFLQPKTWMNIVKVKNKTSVPCLFCSTITA
jgi:hypothetical protein